MPEPSKINADAGNGMTPLMNVLYALRYGGFLLCPLDWSHSRSLRQLDNQEILQQRSNLSNTARDLIKAGASFDAKGPYGESSLQYLDEILDDESFDKVELLESSRDTLNTMREEFCRQQKLALVIALHPRVGKDSSVNRAFIPANPLAELQLVPMIHSFVQGPTLSVNQQSLQVS
jgi:hypothetical protein